jgi:hypothetical protein
MMDPTTGARAIIRDTGSDTGRYLWSVLPVGDMRPVSEGRTDDLDQAKSVAEAALLGDREALGRRPAGGSDQPSECSGP